MPRIRTKPVNLFIQDLMDQRHITELKQLSAEIDVRYATLLDLADAQPKAMPSYRTLEKLAKAGGISVEETVTRFFKTRQAS